MNTADTEALSYLVDVMRNRRRTKPVHKTILDYMGGRATATSSAPVQSSDPADQIDDILSSFVPTHPRYNHYRRLLVKRIRQETRTGNASNTGVLQDMYDQRPQFRSLTYDDFTNLRRTLQAYKGFASKYAFVSPRMEHLGYHKDEADFNPCTLLSSGRTVRSDTRRRGETMLQGIDAILSQAVPSGAYYNQQRQDLIDGALTSQRADLNQKLTLWQEVLDNGGIVGRLPGGAAQEIAELMSKTDLAAGVVSATIMQAIDRKAGSPAEVHPRMNPLAEEIAQAVDAIIAPNAGNFATQRQFVERIWNHRNSLNNPGEIQGLGASARDMNFKKLLDENGPAITTLAHTLRNYHGSWTDGARSQHPQSMQAGAAATGLGRELSDDTHRLQPAHISPADAAKGVPKHGIKRPLEDDHSDIPLAPKHRRLNEPASYPSASRPPELGVPPDTMERFKPPENFKMSVDYYRRILRKIGLKDEFAYRKRPDGDASFIPITIFDEYTYAVPAPVPLMADKNRHEFRLDLWDLSEPSGFYIQTAFDDTRNLRSPRIYTELTKKQFGKLNDDEKILLGTDQASLPLAEFRTYKSGYSDDQKVKLKAIVSKLGLSRTIVDRMRQDLPLLTTKSSKNFGDPAVELVHRLNKRVKGSGVCIQDGSNRVDRRCRYMELSLAEFAFLKEADTTLFTTQQAHMTPGEYAEHRLSHPYSDDERRRMKTHLSDLSVSEHSLASYHRISPNIITFLKEDFPLLTVKSNTMFAGERDMVVSALSDECLLVHQDLHSSKSGSVQRYYDHTGETYAYETHTVTTEKPVYLRLSQHQSAMLNDEDRRRLGFMPTHIRAEIERHQNRLEQYRLTRGEAAQLDEGRDRLKHRAPNNHVR
ncbi:hypothetical protein [Phyllobacterium myrsinacearum]|uniref:hypothetical protein n=1 Tax=Phyllobacterium myrsinacearum TaxID=28101 RepID=UPI001029D70C|nr:hypothetical protein [Phyllobacterium myrsinacearum]